MRFTKKIQFLGGRLMKNQYRGGQLPKKGGWGGGGLGEFTDLREGGLARKRGWCF